MKIDEVHVIKSLQNIDQDGDREYKNGTQSFPVPRDNKGDNYQNFAEQNNKYTVFLFESNQTISELSYQISSNEYCQSQSCDYSNCLGNPEKDPGNLLVRG